MQAAARHLIPERPSSSTACGQCEPQGVRPALQLHAQESLERRGWRQRTCKGAGPRRRPRRTRAAQPGRCRSQTSLQPDFPVFQLP